MHLPVCPRAPRSSVYRALLDREAVQHWMVPDGMTSRVHVFEPHEGGSFRIPLTYDAPTDTGKTDVQTDTFGGTDLLGLHEDLPAGVRQEDNELGWSMAIDKLARLVEPTS